MKAECFGQVGVKNKTETEVLMFESELAEDTRPLNTNTLLCGDPSTKGHLLLMELSAFE